MRHTITAAALLALLASPGQAQATNPVVNVNTATLEQLDFLPRIGPKIADNILYAREIGIIFQTPEDLLQVSGIGPVTLKGMVPYVVFEGKTTATENVTGKATGKTASKKISRPAA